MVKYVILNLNCKVKFDNTLCTYIKKYKNVLYANFGFILIYGKKR